MQDSDRDRATDPVIACTLTEADLEDREKAWLKLQPYVVRSESIAGGLVFTFRGVTGLRDSLAELVRLEAECCAWMTFAMGDSPKAVRLSITGSGEDGEREVRESFAPLTRG